MMERHGNRARPGVQHFGWEKVRAVCHPLAAVSVVPTQAASLRAGIRHSGLVGPIEHHLNIPGSARLGVCRWCPWLYFEDRGQAVVKCIVYKISTRLLAPKVSPAERKRLGEGVLAALFLPVFTEWFSLSKTTARLASGCRLLGCRRHALPLSHVVLLVLSAVLYI